MNNLALLPRALRRRHPLAQPQPAAALALAATLVATMRGRAVQLLSCILLPGILYCPSQI